MHECPQLWDKDVIFPLNGYESLVVVLLKSDTEWEIEAAAHL